MLITVGVIGLLLSLVAAGASYTIGSSRSFKCAMSQRAVAFDFAVFAEDALWTDRGDDARDLKVGRFRLETFVEREYGVDEFWKWGDTPTATFPTPEGDDPLRCPEVRGALTLVRNTPCSQGALEPPQHVSFGFNSRLMRVTVEERPGRFRAVPVTLTAQILTVGNLPLLMDVDGAESVNRGVAPSFLAPGLGERGGPYANDAMWFPALRHGGSMNVAFVDGHVRSTESPLSEGWRWGHSPLP